MLDFGLWGSDYVSTLGMLAAMFWAGRLLLLGGVLVNPYFSSLSLKAPTLASEISES